MVRVSTFRWRDAGAVLSICLLAFVLVACDDDAILETDPDPEPMEETDLRVRFNLQTLPPTLYPPNNPPRQERISLGRMLFFDPIISGEKNVACGTCHHPDFGFADLRQFGAGTSGSGLGPNRILSVSVHTQEIIDLEPRNTPTIWNTAFNGVESPEPSFMGLQFLDGRKEGLEEQALGPIGSRVEMRGDAYPEALTVDSVLARLQAIPEYITRFQDAFPGEGTGPDLITDDTYARAMASYERELVSRNSPYDRYVMGDDDALSLRQKEGLELFFTKAKCGICHNGPMFSDFRFIIQGVPQEGGGKAVLAGDDTGREEHTGDPNDRYKFRTLTLRNIELTAPYMHDGVFNTLEDVVNFYNDGAQPRHPAVTDDMLDTDLKAPLGLTPAEVDAVVVFMRALTDPGTALPTFLTTVPAQVPSGLMPVFGVNGPGSGKAGALPPAHTER